MSFRAFKKPHSSLSITSEIFKLWRSSFSSRCSKFQLDLEKRIKIGAEVFGFWYDCVGTNCGKFSLLKWEYMCSSVNMLKHSPNISHLTIRDLSVLDLSNINGKLLTKHRRDTFQQSFRPANSLPSKVYSEAGAFGHSRNHILRCQELQKYSSYEAELFSQSVENFM